MARIGNHYIKCRHCGKRLLHLLSLENFPQYPGHKAAKYRIQCHDSYWLPGCRKWTFYGIHHAKKEDQQL